MAELDEEYVPGRRQGGAIADGSSGNERLYCFPCSTDGKQIPAHGYCQTCSHHLCKGCFNGHKLPFPMKHHVLLDSIDMPQQPTYTYVDMRDKCTVTCPNHGDKVTEYFCQSHAALVCAVCSNIQHKHCDVQYIPDIAEDLVNSQEYQQFKAFLDAIDTNNDIFQKDADDIISKAIASIEQAVNDVRKYKTDIVTDLTAKERKLVQLGDDLKKDEEKIRHSLNCNSKKVKADLQELKSKLTTFERNNSDLFIAMKQCESSLDPILDLAEQTQASVKSFNYNFELEAIYNDALRTTKRLGKITQQLQDLPIVPVMRYQTWENLTKDVATCEVIKLPDIHLQSAEKYLSFWKSTCNTRGLVLVPPLTLLAADISDNKTIRAIDITSMKVVSQLKMPGKPFDIALLPQGQAAVTLPHEQQVQVIATITPLSLVRNFKVSGLCHGIASTADRLIVSYIDPGKVEVLDHNGSPLYTLDAIFPRPFYVTSSREDDRDVLYVSDYDTNTVTKTTSDGRYLTTYKDKQLSSPLGMAVTEDGQVLVCDSVKQNIQVFCKDGKKIRTLVGKQAIAGRNWSLCYCPQRQELYVGLYHSDVLRRFLFTSK